MPQNKTYLSALNKSKLDKLKRVKLAEAKKIHLSLMDDTNTLIRKVSDLNDVYEEFGSSLENSIEDVKQSLKKMELDMDVLEKDIQLGEKVDAEVTTVLEEIEKSAEALGLSTSSLPSYAKLESDASIMINNIQVVDDLVRQAKNLIG